jgi:hypothetical protein
LALSQLEENYGRDQFLHIDWHVTQSLHNPAAQAREDYYGGVPATPEVFFNGQNSVVGGGQDMYPIYEPIFLASRAESSRIMMEARVDFDATNRTGSVTVDMEVAPGEAITGNLFQLFVFIIEDVQVGATLFKEIGRQSLPVTGLTINNGGDHQTVTHNFVIDAAIQTANIGKLEAIAVVQRTGSLKVQQSRLASHTYDVEVASSARAQSVPLASPADYSTQVTYTGVLNDDVVVTLDKSALPLGWDAEIVWGMTTEPSSLTIPNMSSGQTEAVTIRTIPSGTEGVGRLTVRTEPANDPLRADVRSYNTFNGTPSILYVDDDRGQTFETIFQGSITAAGYFSVTHTVAGMGNPDLETLADFDAVVWSTGDLQTQTIGGDGQAALMSYLDGGGNFFLTSQGYLNQVGLSAMTTNYLRVSAFVQDAQASSAVGLAGDPLGDGLNMPLDPSPPYPIDLADTITPNTGGVAWLTAPSGNVGVHYDSGTFKTVFMSCAFEGISASDPDPNNRTAVMQRILDWFVGGGATDVRPVVAGGSELVLRQNAPNPFTGSTEMSFAVPRTMPVELAIYNVAGSKVVDLLQKPLEAGEYSVVWDGRDSQGFRVASGVYLARLRAGNDVVTREMVLMR